MSVPPHMWDDGRLLAALAALPPETFEPGSADDELRWRRTARRLRQELGAERAAALPPGHLAPVLELRPHLVIDRTG